MARIADPAQFRAEAVVVSWSAVARAQIAAGGQVGGDFPTTTRVSWACHGTLGLPHGPFTVWARPVAPVKLPKTATGVQSYGSGTLLTWGTPAGRVVVTGTVVDPTRPVTVQLCWQAPSAQSVVASSSQTASGTISVDLRCGGATCAVVTNLGSTSVAVQSLDAIVNDPAWKPLELVGLPVDGPLGDYDTGKQGLLTALEAPGDAALDRLHRGAPPLGWFPTLPSGLAAPPWLAPDPARLVAALQAKLLPEVADLYTPGLPENRQRTLTRPVAVPAPGQTALGTGPDTVIDAAPWPTLAVPAQTDASLNLALGLGTAYRGSPVSVLRVQTEYLVTATYRNGPAIDLLGITFDGLPGGEYAAYAPPVPHAQTVPAFGLTAARYSLRAPAALDGPWSENVRLRWPSPLVGAGWGHVTEQAHVTYDVGDARATSACELDPDHGGWRIPTLPSVDTDGKLDVVDPYHEIVVGSGGRHLGYGVAQCDVQGVWSPWTEVRLDTTEPAATPPTVANPALRASYSGSASACPTHLAVETMLEWTRRSTASVELTAVLYPMVGPSTPPPAGVGPGVAPAGCRTASWSVTFTGDVPTGVGCTVTPLTQDGYDRVDDDANPATPPVPVPPGPDQGEPRRFRVDVDLPPLDFTGTARWGVVVWARRRTSVGPSPTDWAASDPSRWLIATVGSPVPVVPVVVPLPGVPLASMPDAQGRCHVTIAWGAPTDVPVKSWVVWGTTEGNLRDRLGLPAPAPDAVPGARLLELRTALAAHGEAARTAFRRVLEVAEAPSSPRVADVALARGADDLQLFVVTSTTTSGTDSPFPVVGLDTQAQAFMAPRVVRPAPPLLRTVVTTTGVDVDLETSSDVPVGAFRLYRTRVFDAARRADSMGAPSVVPAVAVLDGGAPVLDARTGLPVYSAETALATGTGWQPSYLRAVAVPDTSGVPERAVRGLLSGESDIVTVSTPPSAGPDLAPLVVSDGTPDHLVLVARSSTAAPDDTAWGPHRVAGAGATLDDAALAALVTVPLGDVLTLGDGTPAPPTLPTPGQAVLVRGPRVAGRTPVAVWFARADATQPADVALRLVDPLGRAVVQRATAPGVVPPTPPTLTVVEAVALSASACRVTVATSLSRTAVPSGVLTASASRPPSHGRLQLPIRGQVQLAAIPPSSSVTVTPRRLTFGWRWVLALPLRRPRTVYDILVPLASPVRVEVTVTAPDGGSASVVATVP